MLSVYAQSHLTASQGFTIETNDMDGKVKSQKCMQKIKILQFQG